MTEQGAKRLAAVIPAEMPAVRATFSDKHAHRGHGYHVELELVPLGLHLSVNYADTWIGIKEAWTEALALTERTNV